MKGLMANKLVQNIGFLLLALGISWLALKFLQLTGEWATLIFFSITIVGLLSHAKPPKFGKKSQNEKGGDGE